MSKITVNKLTSYGPVSLNSGLSGNPKTHRFGDAMRTFVSSQNGKYYTITHGELFAAKMREMPSVEINGVKFVPGTPMDSRLPDFAANFIAPRVAERAGIANDQHLVKTCLAVLEYCCSSSKDEKDDSTGRGKAGDQPVMLDESEIETMIEVLSSNHDKLGKVTKKGMPEEEEWFRPVIDIKEGRTASLILCLLGRFNASNQDQTVRGCFQFSPSISTNEHQAFTDMVSRHNDLSQGASFMAYPQYSSPCLYSQVRLDLDLFVENLAKVAGGSIEEVREQTRDLQRLVVDAFVEAVIYSGSKVHVNQTSHDTVPSLVWCEVTPATGGHVAINHINAFRTATKAATADPVFDAAAKLDSYVEAVRFRLTRRAGVGGKLVALAVEKDVENVMPRFKDGGLFVESDEELISTIIAALD